MLRSLNELLGYTIRAQDGEIGKVDGFYFDDKTWTIRYLVVETGTWLHRQQVLVSPLALGEPDWSRKLLPVLLTKEQVRNSPDISTDKPVSRRQEMVMNEYYGWPQYWAIEPVLIAPPMGSAAQVKSEESGDPHLRSFREVSTYRAHTSDGHLGHVKDFLVDQESWAVCYLEVDTGAWLPGNKVMVATGSIEEVSWSRKEVRVDGARHTAGKGREPDASSAASHDSGIGVRERSGSAGCL